MWSVRLDNTARVLYGSGMTNRTLRFTAADRRSYSFWLRIFTIIMVLAIAGMALAGGYGEPPQTGLV